MIYVTGASGLIGSRFSECFNRDITTISYRDKVKDVFQSHQDSCLVHLAWSSTTRDTDPEKVRNDIWNSQKLFNFYVNKNPNGKIIFVSSAGDMHLNHEGEFCSEVDDPTPRTLYGRSKLHVEQILNTLKCKTVVLRTSNVWGGRVKKDRVNGLVDKLRGSLNTDEEISIYANLKSHIDLIHVDDFITLLIKVIDKDLENDHELFLVGGQSISIANILERVTKSVIRHAPATEYFPEKNFPGVLVLRKDPTADKSYISVQPFKAERVFDWKRERFL